VVARGEIWWVELPDAGARPALVLTREQAIPVLRRVVVVPATRTVRDIPTEVRLSIDDGMPEECALSFDNISTIAKSSLRSRICALGPERMAEVCQAWRDVADC
jgi:mRNA interferase MazF